MNKKEKLNAIEHIKKTGRCPCSPEKHCPCHRYIDSDECFCGVFVTEIK